MNFLKALSIGMCAHVSISWLLILTLSVYTPPAIWQILVLFFLPPAIGISFSYSVSRCK